MVGTRRYTHQGVNPSIAKIVGQAEANFKHLGTFPGTVVSVDLGEELSGEHLPHIKGDWLSLKVPKESLRNVFFEWFPTCHPETWECLLLLAVKKAFSALKPGGKLVIDLQPYTRTLDGDNKQDIHLLPAGLIKRMADSGVKLNNEGISSALKKFDPFTLTFTKSEKREICEKLLEHYESESTLPQLLEESIKICFPMFAEKYPDRLEFIGELNNMIVSESRLYAVGSSVDSVFSPEHNMFEWVYGTLSRKQDMIAALRAIGFSANDKDVQYMESNPYNQRRYAWLFTATKPELPTPIAVA